MTGMLLLYVLTVHFPQIEHGSEKYLAWVKQCTEKTIK